MALATVTERRTLLEFRKLADLDVPSVGLGTYKTFDVTSDEDVGVRRRVIDSCLASQTAFVDTSPMYGEAEAVIGLAIGGRREQFQLATKVWSRGADEGEAQIARSFELLGTDYIDVFQVHNLVDWRTQLPTLEQLRERGKIGLLGITTMRPDHYPEAIEIMRTGRIQTIQVPFNVLDRACEAEVLPLAEELGIGVIVMEPLKKGRYVKELKGAPDLAPLAEYGIETWGQALLAWVLGDARVSVAIPATSRPERVAENAVAGSAGRLPEELRDYVRKETERLV